MPDSKKTQLTLNIGGQDVSVLVPVKRQEFARETEKEITALYKKWRLQFPSKPDKEILAMVTYQYASYYKTLLEHYNEATLIARKCLNIIEEDADSAESATDWPLPESMD